MPSPQSTSAAGAGRGFRQDINGLRAIAAMAVVLFHFDVPGFGGGFCGVDIFFVISGLLMTQIIESGLDRRTFSLTAFYAARVRRIVPAIAVCCLAVMPYGILFLDPLTLEGTAENALSTMLFYSNMRYAMQGSYFADAAETNWFLHSWTLSAEWQFYMLYPVLLIIASRWRWLWRHRFWAALLACLLLLAVTMAFAGMASKYRDLAFYLLPTRAWEMLAGGCVAFLPQGAIARPLRWPLHWLGLLIIVASILLIDEALPWPSPWMIAPVVGTALLLAAGQGAPAWARLRPVAALGQWSYSLYLWHWPVVAAFHYHGVPEGAGRIVSGLALSISLAALSFILVENRLRDALLGPRAGATARRWAVFWTGWLAIVALVGAGAATKGFFAVRTASTSPAARAAMTDYRAATSDWAGFAPCEAHSFGLGKICTVGAKGDPRVLLIGDSHSEEMLPRLGPVARAQRLSITLVRQPGCPPLPGLRLTGFGDECGTFADRALTLAETGGYKRVVIFAAWSLYAGDAPARPFDPGRFCEPALLRCRPFTSEALAWRAIEGGVTALSEHLARLSKRGVEVAIVLPQPVPEAGDPRAYYRQTFETGVPALPTPILLTVFQRDTAHIRTLLERAAKASGARLVDPLAVQCPDGRCTRFVRERYLFKDGHHVRASPIRDERFAWIDRALAGR